MAKRKGAVSPRIIVCEVSGRSFEYMGYGRPPKYHPEVAKSRARERRIMAYVAKQAQKGKTVKHKPSFATV